MRKFIINVNGNQYEVEVEEVTDLASKSKIADSNPLPKSVQPNPEAKPVKRKKEVVLEGVEIIKAPMPGTILNININEGDKVKSGQVLFILEAMKMENEILAPRDGKVVSIGTTENASVNTGDELATIE